MTQTANAGQTTATRFQYHDAGEGAARVAGTLDRFDMSAAAAGETVASVVYSAAAIAELVYMIEEEKLAGDVYELFHDLYGLEVFDNIAESEDRHFDALIQQAETIGLDVRAYLEEDEGTFEDTELQALFDALIAQGRQSVTDALEVGVLIEEKDMVDIAEAIEHVEDTQLADVYENLLDGSADHLDAFLFVLG